MEKRKNIFGEGIIYQKEDIAGKIYATSAACMSVWSDMLSFANANKEHFVKNVEEADSIVVLGCQVTDLAILNDLEVAKKLHDETQKEIYMGGCLAQRMDICLPEYIKRLDVVREYGQEIIDRNLVHYEKPFWVVDFEESKDPLQAGNLFRNYYPLKIGAGCHGKCKYCTIRHTRGETYEAVAENQIEEFLNHENVVLTSDSPTVTQIKAWCNIAKSYQKSFSIRNIEPQNLVQCKKELLELASLGLLDIVHCPVQSFNHELLKAMNRNIEKTEEAVKLMKQLREMGVVTATNIIIDYRVDGKMYHNFDQEKLNEVFDYFSWNPYFDGNFNLDKAKVRFKKYIVDGKVE